MSYYLYINFNELLGHYTRDSQRKVCSVSRPFLFPNFSQKWKVLTKFIKTPNYEINHANRQKETETESNGTANQSISTVATVNSAKARTNNLQGM
jgi:hypothetical protein